MMKKLYFMLACLASASSAFAQDKATTTSETISETVEYDEYKSLRSNWFVTAAAGPQVYFGDHDRQCKMGDRIAPIAEIGLGKWISPILGIRAMYSWGQQRGATQYGNLAYETGHDVPGKGHDNPDYDLQQQKFSFGNLHVVAMLNLTNLICGYKDNRVYTCTGYMGVGYAQVYNHLTKGPGYAVGYGKNHKKSGSEVTGNIGLLQNFRLNSMFDLNLDVRGMYVNDRFDAEGGGRFGEGNWSVTAGVTYKFKRQGFNGNKVVTRTINTTTYNETELARMRDEMNRLMAENKRIQDELAAAQATTKNSNSVKTEKKFVAAPNLIVFEINKSTLSNEARVNIGMFADLIKSCDPSVVYTISGYADKGTGSVEINERLSRERAEAVYNCLIKEFGVNPNQLKLVSNGGVENMFYNDPRLSRAVISRAE